MTNVHRGEYLGHLVAEFLVSEWIQSGNQTSIGSHGTLYHYH